MAQNLSLPPCKPLVVDETFFQSSFVFRSIPSMQELVQPLKELDIACFIYSAYYPDGGHVNLSNEPTSMRYYYEHQLFDGTCYTQSSLPDTIMLGNWLNIEKKFVDFRKYFGLSASFAVIQNHPGFRECYHFKVPIQQEAALPALFNRLDLLYSFIAYFKDQGHSLVQEAHQNRLQLPVSHAAIHANTSCYTAQNITRFLQATGIKRFYLGPEFDHAYLTRREMDVISLLVQGKNLSDIGRQLQLSYKTMDTHLTHIKEKLKCKTLFDVGFKVGHIGKEKLFQKRTKEKEK